MEVALNGSCAHNVLARLVAGSGPAQPAGPHLGCAALQLELQQRLQVGQARLGRPLCSLGPLHQLQAPTSERLTGGCPQRGAARTYWTYAGCTSTWPASAMGTCAPAAASDQADLA